MDHKAGCVTFIDLSCKKCATRVWSDESMLLQIESILEGIDQCELESEDGWWDTENGARWGARKLKEIRDLFKRA